MKFLFKLLMGMALVLASVNGYAITITNPTSVGFTVYAPHESGADCGGGKSSWHESILVPNGSLSLNGSYVCALQSSTKTQSCGASAEAYTTCTVTLSIPGNYCTCS